jgi:hypothetical protein
MSLHLFKKNIRVFADSAVQEWHIRVT